MWKIILYNILKIWIFFLFNQITLYFQHGPKATSVTSATDSTPNSSTSEGEEEEKV